MSKQIKRGFAALVGKTIELVDEHFANCVFIKMTDGTEVMIDTEAMGSGIYSPVVYPNETKETA